VGYRQFAAETARSLRVTGWVRNLPTGEVEAEADGDEATLKLFEARLQQGPQLARVDRLAVQDMPATETAQTGFEIRR
jgi:acylphosphatase